MTPGEMKLLMEELNRTHEQLLAAMKAYEQTMENIRNGLVPGATIPDAVGQTLESVKLCRSQMEMTRQTILNNIG